MSCRPQRAIRLTDAAAGRPASPLEGIFLFLHRLTLWLAFDARLQHNAVFQWRSRDSSSMTYLIFAAAALAEIAGCFAFWAWWRLDKSPLWLAPGLAALIAFAWLLTLVEADVRRPRLRRLWRHLYFGVAAVAVGRRRAAPRPLGCRRGRHLPCRRDRYCGGAARGVTWSFPPHSVRRSTGRWRARRFPNCGVRRILLSRRNRTELRDGRLHLSDDLAVKA